MTTELEIQCDDVEIGNATVVHIGIREKPVNGHILTLYPQRNGDALIFHTEPNHSRAPEKPREVRWVVHGLAEGESIVIEAKTSGSGTMPQDSYTITHPCRSIRSGESLRHPAPALELPWPYDVILRNAAGEERDRLDPVIVIKNDP